ncbi:hypothetical protein NPIL_320771 [Nephila pilipes]|uniref:Endonuclease/exonuclease/phosphatase domain-containing protein n=1 Tax=Nephila pilipes TaxID=299642 RepID=A0A8X6TG42_NEPPI|nr:hypothetical protein NPIL_320771 [Nephila pilipes]
MCRLELATLFRIRGKCIIAGDLNTKHLTWNPSTNNRKGTILYQFLQNRGYSLHAPNQPTKYHYSGTKSTIDICISRSLNSITAETIQAVSSDRYKFHFQVQLLGFNSPPFNSIEFTIWNKFQEQLALITPGSSNSFSISLGIRFQ